MSRVVVKICGITTPEDGLMAARAGADAVGLNFYPRSSRYISVARARAIVRALPPLVWAVGVFVDEPSAHVRKVARAVGLHAVQLHGAETRAEVKAVGLPVLKAIAVSTTKDALAARRFAGAAWGVLLDAAQPGHGGGGVRFDWRLARAVARHHSVLLAGGLTPDNVAEAIATVRPWGVDVASGVERSPGVKSPALVRRFITEARRAAKGPS